MESSDLQRAKIGDIYLRMSVAAIVCSMLVIFATVPSGAQTFTVLYDFNCLIACGPLAGLTLDRAGNLYGTTTASLDGFGTVYKLSRAGTGWVLTTLYVFQGGNDGGDPQARVIFGPDGTLYGTTAGTTGAVSTVFNLRPPASVCRAVQCPWTETVLYRFSGADGYAPGYGDLIFDTAGNIYGTTSRGGGNSCSQGAQNCGVVFKLSRSGGQWTETVLYNFTGDADGAVPFNGVTFDSAGNLYGTTLNGGAHGFGTVYELSPSPTGWTETTLHSFGAANDGYSAFGGVIFDAHGNLYGTTFGGGAGSPPGGTVYQLQASGGGWNYSVLISLSGQQGPTATPTLDSAGNLFAGTAGDGAIDFGNVFELSPNNDGWTYTDLHDFDGSDGTCPVGVVAIDPSGNLYGTTFEGGTDVGVAFQVTP